MKVKVKQNQVMSGGRGASPPEYHSGEKKYKPTKKMGDLVGRMGTGGSGIVANRTLGISGPLQDGQGLHPLLPTGTADDFAYSQDMFGEEEIAEVLENRQDGSSQTNYMPLRGSDVLLAQYSRRSEQLELGSKELSRNMPLVTDFQQHLPRLNDSDFDLSPGLLGTLQFSESEAGLSLSQLCENQDLTQIGHMPQGHSQNMQAGPSYALPQDNTGHYMESAPEEKVFTAQGAAGRGPCPIDDMTVLENWASEYKFNVRPVAADSTTKQKYFYSTENNQLFCKNFTAVPFKFEMDYANIQNLSEFTVRASLAFEEPDKLNDPVLSCTTHIEKEQPITDEKHYNRLVHILRPSQPLADTEYIQSKATRRCYLSFPATFPEPGMSWVIRSYTFVCLNSCQGTTAISRKPLSLLFCLFDMNGKLVGRSFMHLRICSAPQRDFNKAKQRQGNECRKRRGGSDEVQLGLPDPKKLQTCNFEEIADEERTLEAIPSTSRGLTVHTPAMIRNVVTMSKAAEEDLVSSSQETVYSCDESEQRINLRRLVKDVKHVLDMKKSPNVCLNQYARSVYNSLKLTQELCVSARKVEEELLHGCDGQEKSPDGGFDEQLQ